MKLTKLILEILDISLMIAAGFTLLLSMKNCIGIFFIVIALIRLVNNRIGR